jgi:hypothetical protein
VDDRIATLDVEQLEQVLAMADDLFVIWPWVLRTLKMSSPW